VAAEKPANVVPLRPQGRCAICGKPTVREFYPFCSKRCTNIDLNRWLSGSYAIPAAEEEPSGDEREKDDDQV
jgi:endogenous inhibitor of DNA gyrase (YacG/DUF329 family)